MKNKKKRSKKRKLIIAVSAILVVCAVMTVAMGNILYSFALDRTSPFGLEKIMMASLKKTDYSKENMENTSQQYSGFGGSEKDIKWFDKTADEMFITSEDGLKLHAYTLDNDSHKYMIVCHGYTSKAHDMVVSIKHFHDMGFNILAPDARAHGDSEGNIRGMGWLERKDVMLWIDEILKKDSKAEIALYGISMGGATVMIVSGEDLPENVKCIIEDCGYSSVWDEFHIQIKSMLKLPSFPLLNVASVVTKVRAGYNFKEASATEQVKKCKVPMLFIHGDADTFVPFSMLDVVYEAAECEKDKLVVPGASHAMSSAVAPDVYWNTVETFIEKNM